ncbi:MAG: heavy metal translocating P-type ATPase metal-binding domain-containing protein [Ignavibacteriaceae bacterium]|nr:heavy metal translocating P-type ATPase metal-binding domain-containing protein [Ignavibacteriaceae bacterium]
MPEKEEVLKLNITRCYHCGEKNPENPVLLQDKSFCCEGCKMVYEILEENNLCNYYSYSDNPGKSKKNSFESKDYSYLDIDELKDKFVNYSDSEISQASFMIPDMHCSSCIWLLENLTRFDENILESKVNFPAKKLFVKFKTKLKLSTLVTLLDRIGYEPDLSFENLDQESKKNTNRSLYIKLGIAGFAFGNVMMLSFPEYLAITDNPESLGNFFRYLMVALSIPVFFYSASYYYVSTWKGLKSGTINIDFPLTLGILALYFRSLFEIFTDSGPGYLDSFTGLIFLLLIGKIFQTKTYDFFNFERNFKSYFPISVVVKKDGVETPVPLSKLEKGNKILIRNNEVIPADSYLLSGNANIDYSFVTGESIPQIRKVGDKIFAGGRQHGGIIELELYRDVSQSYLTNLWNEFKQTKKLISVYTNLSNLISKYFVYILLTISIAAFVFWLPSGWVHAVTVFSSILIIACPCAAALSTPFTFGNTLRLLGKNQFYLKNAVSLEKIAQTKAIVFDKTGTVTSNKYFGIEFVGTTLDDFEKTLVKTSVKNSLHPLSKIIYKHLEESLEVKPDLFNEFAGLGTECVTGEFKVLTGSLKYLNNNGITVSDKLSVDSHETTKVHIAINNNYRGYFKITNSYRTEVLDSIKKLHDKYEVFLLSGDNDSEREYLSKYFLNADNLHFNMSPADKRDFILKIKNEFQSVMMIGDGLNDTGALGSSDTGISVTEDLMSFTPSSDVILRADELSKIGNFIKLAKDSLNVIKINLVISFIYNIVGVTVAVQGNLTPLFAAILMPLSSISVILISFTGTVLASKKRGLL